MIRDFTATLTRKEQLAPHIWGLTFAMQPGEALDFMAGQYVILKVDNNYRQYSISSSQSEKTTFDLIVEMVENGVGSTFFTNLQIGQTADFKGPAGVFVLRDTPKDKIFLATGTGIAPIKSMIETYFTPHEHATPLPEAETLQLRLFFGLKTKADMYLYEEFVKLHDHHHNFSFSMCLSREESLLGDTGDMCMTKGRIDAGFEGFLKEQQKHISEFEFYICGSKHVVEALRQFVASLGAPAEQVFFEKFTI